MLYRADYAYTTLRPGAVYGYTLLLNCPDLTTAQMEALNRVSIDARLESVQLAPARMQEICK